MVISETEELEKLKSLSTLIVNSGYPSAEDFSLSSRPVESIVSKTREWQTKWTDFLTSLDSGQPLKISNLIVALIEMRTNLRDWENAFSSASKTPPNPFYPLKTNIFDLSIHLSDFLEAKVNRLEKGRSKIKGKLKEWGKLIVK